MAATYVTEAELRLVLGIGSLYSSAVVEECCQSAENIIKGHLWFNNYFADAQKIDTNVATLYFNMPHDMYVGQSVVVSNAGSSYNGTKTITAKTMYTISYAAVYADQLQHEIRPTATVAATMYIDFAVIPEIREASTLIAVDIWQSRQLSNAGGVSPDGFTPSPYRMGNTLLARCRGLIANYLNPAGMCG